MPRSKKESSNKRVDMLVEKAWNQDERLYQDELKKSAG